MTYAPKLVLLACSLALSACSHYSDDLSSVEGEVSKYPTYAQTSLPQEIAPAAGDMSLPDAPANRALMNQALAKGYCDMARYENDKAYDYKAAKIFTQKAVLASKGKTFAPAKLSNYDLPASRLAELSEARAALIAVLKDQATVEGNQAAVAKAQTSFDCWVERAEEATKDTHYAECKGEFEQAMASIVAPAAGGFATPNILDIPFAQNSTSFDAGSSSAIEQAAVFLNAPQAAGYTAVLTGFTDTTVSSDYATKLATNRVFAVRDALIARGVSDARIKPQITSTPYGTVAPNTADGIAPLGRKVQIFLSPPTGRNGFIPASATTTIR